MQFGCKGSKNIAYLQIFVEFSVVSFAINVLNAIISKCQYIEMPLYRNAIMSKSRDTDISKYRNTVISFRPYLCASPVACFCLFLILKSFFYINYLHIWQKSSIFAAHFVNYLIRYLFENIRKLTK